MRATAHRERELIATRLEEVTEVESVALRFVISPRTAAWWRRCGRRNSATPISNESIWNTCTTDGQRCRLPLS
jgi:hypothetical protein